MPFPTNDSVPPDIKRRFTGHCRTVWRETFNETLDRHGDEGRAFATAELAGKKCKESTVGDKTFAVKFVDGSDNVIEGLAIPFGGPFAGKDLHGEDFGPDTDLALEWFPTEGRPVLYNHGLDESVKGAPVGRQIERTLTDLGHWAKVQLDKRSRYFEAIKELVDKEALAFSSGAIPHLVQARKDGHIEHWPWVELSLTPTPANPEAMVYAVKTVDAIEHIAAVKAAIPDPLREAIDESLDASLAGLSYADHSDRVLVSVKAFVERSQEIAHLRAKAGRVLSAANRQRLAQHLESLEGLRKDLARLLEETDPDAAAKTARAEFVRFQQQLARQNGVSV